MQPSDARVGADGTANLPQVWVRDKLADATGYPLRQCTDQACPTTASSGALSAGGPRRWPRVG